MKNGLLRVMPCSIASTLIVLTSNTSAFAGMTPDNPAQYHTGKKPFMRSCARCHKAYWLRNLISNVFPK